MKFKRLPDLNKRLVASLFIAAIFTFLIAFSRHPWVGMLMVLGAALLAVVGIWEYVQLVLAKDLKPASKLMMGLAFCEVIVFCFAQKNPSFGLLPLTVLLIGVVGFFIYHFRESEHALLNIAVEFFGVCYAANSGKGVAIFYDSIAFQKGFGKISDLTHDTNEHTQPDRIGKGKVKHAMREMFSDKVDQHAGSYGREEASDRAFDCFLRA